MLVKSLRKPVLKQKRVKLNTGCMRTALKLDACPGQK